MADVTRAWLSDPCRGDARTLAGLWADFEYRVTTPKFAPDRVVEVVVAAPDLPAAILAACESRGKNGKMSNHQSKVDRSARLAFAAKLTQYRLHAMPTFHDLYLLADEVKPFGIGPLTVYDVCSRLSYRFHLPVEKIYLHAGASMGLRALGIKFTNGLRWVEREALPPTLAGVPNLDRVEDFLCTYRHQLASLSEGEKRHG